MANVDLPTRCGSALAVVLWGLVGTAVQAGEPEQASVIQSNIEAASTTTEKEQDLVIVPVPQSNPTIGSGLAVAGALLYQPEGSPRPWTTGVGAMYTTSDSWAVGALQKAYLAGDRLRLSATVAYGSFNLDFYGIGSEAGQRNEPVEINQRGGLAVFDGQIRIAPNLFAGAHYRLIDTETRLDLSDLPAFQGLDIPEHHLDAVTSAIGPILVYDSRDNEFAPRSGEFATIQYLQAVDALGSDFNYGKLMIAGNLYRPLDEKSVIAARVSMCAADSGAPFFDICLYGSSKDLRGYSAGQYRDYASFATQVEYRRQLGGRFGFVVFAGVGGISDKFTNFDNYRILPAAGAGLRISTSKDFGVNLSIDYAVGKDSSGLYVYIAEAF